MRKAAEYDNSILLFHRDLRLNDNSALNAALQQSQRVFPCFIVDKKLLNQLSSHVPRAQYLFARLQELNTALQEKDSRLHVIFSTVSDGLRDLHKTLDAQAVFFHRDAGAYAVQRNAILEKISGDLAMDCHVIDDITLHPPELTLKPDGTAYNIFTPFFRRASQLPVPKPEKMSAGELSSLTGHRYSLEHALGIANIAVNINLSPDAETKSALSQLKKLKNYENTRGIPSLTGTSHLSAALRFGIISVREAWWNISMALGNEHPLLRQLYWRDFFFSISLYYPHVFHSCFHQQYNKIPWPNNAQWLKAWQTGKTGFPIVDAGMRELQETGYMHNRVRMIVASFLVKDLHCDWRLGERHFAQQLIDYDPCINNGNWQWAASTGCDAQPYFRIFNPWTQQQKFDPDCAYIKRWLPELANIPSRTLHNLYKLDEALQGYVMPIIDHGTQSKIAKQLFEAVRATP